MCINGPIAHKFIRYPALVIYYAFLRHLPQYLPNGHECRSIRSKCCKYIFCKCGNNVNVKKGAFFGSGRNIQIGNDSDIGINCQIMGIDGGGELIIGDNVMMAPEVIILTVAHDILNTSKREATRVIIEDGAWIGIRSIIMPGVVTGGIIFPKCGGIIFPT